MVTQIRELGVNLRGTPGAYNAITDVPGVTVGHHTIIKGNGQLKKGNGPVRTGVTAVLPRGTDLRPVFAAGYSLNGAGEFTGMHWIEESGMLYGPICTTNTHSIGAVHETVIEWMNQHDTGENMPFCLPVVAETYDGFLNDINGFHVKSEHVINALTSASTGKTKQGNVGGGTGMICHQFKGGIGSASRLVATQETACTLGVLVQANYGERDALVINGVPVGTVLTNQMPTIQAPEKGSIIVIIACDAPLLPHQLKRLARRVPMGMAKLGSHAGNLSGDIFIAFSTANVVTHDKLIDLKMLPNEHMDPLFKATVEATEEAILNALTAAETMTGINDTTVYQLPHDQLKAVMAKYGR
jgi:D-aminopeptidase